MVRAVLSSSYNPETKIWSGKKIADPNTSIWSDKKLTDLLDHPNTSLGQIIYQRILINPKKVIQINDSEGTSLTNEEVLSLSVEVALELQNLKQSDFVGTMASNTSYMLPVVYGCLFAAVPFHPLNISYDKMTVLHCWSQSRPKMIFCDASVYYLVKSVVEDLDLDAPIYIINDCIEGVKHIKDIFAERQVTQYYHPADIENGNQTAVVINSSGTTGNPKAVIISHNRIKSFPYMICFNNITSEDISLVFTTLDWMSSWRNMFSAALAGCTRLVTCEPIRPELCFRLVNKYKVTHLTIYPGLISAIKNFKTINKLTSVTAVLTTGAKLSLETISGFKELLNANCEYTEVYGVTEGGPFTANISNVPGSCGALVPNVEVKLVDENGNLLGPNEDGEILGRQDVPWLGYLNNEEATREVYDKKTHWLKTGDLGRFDDKGNLYIIDRIKEMIKCTGFKFSPIELEILISKLAGVLDVCVVGIPNERTGQLPAALVVKSLEIDITEKDILRHLSQSIPEFKQLKGGVYFIDSIPKTGSGKLSRGKAKELAHKLWNKRNV